MPVSRITPFPAARPAASPVLVLPEVSVLIDPSSPGSRSVLHVNVSRGVCRPGVMSGRGSCGCGMPQKDMEVVSLYG